MHYLSDRGLLIIVFGILAALASCILLYLYLKGKNHKRWLTPREIERVERELSKLEEGRRWDKK